MGNRRLANAFSPRALVILLAALLGLRSLGAIVTHIRLFLDAYQTSGAEVTFAERAWSAVDVYAALLYGALGLPSTVLRLWLGLSIILAIAGLCSAWLLFALRPAGRWLVFGLVAAHVVAYISLWINAAIHRIGMNHDPRAFAFYALYIVVLTWRPVARVFARESAAS